MLGLIVLLLYVKIIPYNERNNWLWQKEQNNLKFALIWLLPTWTELVVYLFIVPFSLLCSQDFINGLTFLDWRF